MNGAELDAVKATQEDLPQIRLGRRVLRFLDLGLRQTEKERLLTDIASLEAAIDRYKLNGGQTDPSWQQRCRDEIGMAKRAANRSMVGSGYEHLHNAERESVAGMSPEERHTRSITILREAADSKFQSEWRRQAVYDIFDVTPSNDGKLPSDAVRKLQVSKEQLMEAVWHRNTGDRNRHRKLDRLRWQLSLVSILITLFVAVAVIASHLITADNVTFGGVNLLAFPEAVYMGLLGGFLSAAFSIRKSNQYAKVPEIQNDLYLALARGMTGAAAAIPVYILVRLQLITIARGEFAPWDLLFLCFLAGFSERWFLSAVASVASGKDDKSDKSS